MLAPGARLGPYEILAAAGAGGMGEVYRARDTRLERTVAIKVLAAELGGRPELLQRFEREARAVSTLNHPNICTLHDVGNDDGRPYLVMEYLEGETLAGRLERGALPLADFWRVAVQIGEALDQAHRRGIVHRDLKPGNVMLTGPRGSTTVKLLDFGLAKISEASPVPGTLTSLPTVVQGLTMEGSIVGTFQYMAPEQLEGKEADARCDLFAFGAVLYEMISGRKAFEGQSQASLISHIMTADPPPVSTLQPAAPPALDRCIRQCLAKNPEDRWQTARDLVHELRWVSESGSQAGAPAAGATRTRGRIQAAWIAAGVLTVALLALLAIHLREEPPALHAVRFLVSPPEKTAFRWFDTLALSPDGTRMVFGAGGDPPVLYLRSIDAVEARPIPGTEGGRFPFWSPDGRYLGFFAQGKLKKVDLTGGPAIALCDVAYGFGGTWNRDNVILFSPDAPSPLSRVSAAGGAPVPATRLDGAGQIGHSFPSFLPDGQHFLMAVTSSRAERRGVYLGSLGSLETTQLLTIDSIGQYSDPGFLVFYQNDAVWGRPFDAKGLRLTGEAFPIGDRAASFAPGFGSLGGAFSAAGGALAYRLAASATEAQMAWFDRKGTRLSNLGTPADYSNPALSPDGQTLAVGKRDPATKTRDIWLFDLARGTSMKLTFDAADDTNPLWSPDGKTIAFTSDRKGHRDVYRKAASGVGQEELMVQSEADKSLEDWSRDGRFLTFNRLAGSNRDVWTMPLSGDRKASGLSLGPGTNQQSQVSPDGRWIAYNSVESGRQEIFVQDFPPAGGKWQVSANGGAQPSWRRDGKELFYIQGDKLMAADVNISGARFEYGTPRELFGDIHLAPLGRNMYVPAPDGQKFLIVTRSQNTSTLPITVILNWVAGVKR